MQDFFWRSDEFHRNSRVLEHFKVKCNFYKKFVLHSKHISILLAVCKSNLFVSFSTFSIFISSLAFSHLHIWNEWVSWRKLISNKCKFKNLACFIACNYDVHGNVKWSCLMDLLTCSFYSLNVTTYIYKKKKIIQTVNSSFLDLLN